MQNKIYKLLSSAKQGLFAFVLTVFLGTAYAQTYTLNYTGGAQTLSIPATGNYLIECWGADGGDVTQGPGGGGKGGYSVGEFNVTTPGLLLNILVGGKGGTASGSGSPAGAGGWNGGGGGGTIGRSGGGGGGATDVRLGGLSASNRIIVAGGGGGAAYYSLLAAGGNGGGVIAQNGDVISSGNVVTTGGGGAGANGGSPGLSSTGYIPTNGTATGGGGGGNSPGVGVGQPGIGGGAGGAGGSGGSGSTGSSGGGGGGFAGGAGGTQTGNMGSAGGGGSGYIGSAISNGTTFAMGQTGFVANPAITGNGMVLITRLCNISIFPSQNPMCVGNAITLTSDALSGVTWSSGSNTPSINVNPTVTTTYSLVGTSTVIVGSGTVNCVTSSFITVTVNPLPMLSIVAFPTVACSGGTSSLTGLGAHSPTSYSWSNGMNGVQTATVIPTGNTTYTLTGVNSFGCSNTQTIELQVNTNVLSVNQSTTAVCSGQSANLTASGAVTYTWSNGLMFQSIPVTPTTTTIYTVTGTDLDNCNISNSLTLTVFNNPTVSISSDKTVLCKGESITLTGAGATSYSWSSSDLTASVVYTLASDITYYYSVTGKDANGCSSTANFSITASRCTAINEAASFSSVVGIYPNPSNGQFDISISQVTDHLNVKVYNALGMLVKTQQILSNESKLDLMNETNGIYFINICDQNNVIKTIKIIKQ